MNITIIGTGYVGLVSGACFAECGHDVTCMDLDTAKIDALKHGKIPIYEPGLDRLVERGILSGLLHFTTSYGEHIGESDAVFLAVGTPTRLEDGEADLSYLFSAVEMLAPHLRDRTVIVSKSTVPVGTGDRIEALLFRLRPDAEFDVASCPEFLREGAAVSDFMSPDRIIVGAESSYGVEVLRDVYRPLIERGAPFRAMMRRSAEISKYAANAFLATKITFVNELADYCEKVGATIEDVTDGLGLDKRIGPDFLQPGPGFGGSCFPKDTLALLRHGELNDTSLQILETVVTVNDRRKRTMARRVAAACGGSVAGKNVALLGVTFKANTDDLRDSPAIPLVRRLTEDGAHITAVDPAGRENAMKMPVFDDVDWVEDVRAAIDGADVAVIVTDWSAFKEVSLAEYAELMETPTIVDLRNLFDPIDAANAGVSYVSIGRPPQDGLHKIAAKGRFIDRGRPEETIAGDVAA